jgi:hypothetical protein
MPDFNLQVNGSEREVTVAAAVLRHRLRFSGANFGVDLAFRRLQADSRVTVQMQG